MANKHQPVSSISKAGIRKRAQRAVSLNGERCSKCGSTDLLDRHHPDYSKPEEVEILCRHCHRLEDATDGTWVSARVTTAICEICKTEFQPKRSRRSKLCGNPECLRQKGILSAQKRWKAEEIA